MGFVQTLEARYQREFDISTILIFADDYNDDYNKEQMSSCTLLVLLNLHNNKPLLYIF